MVVLEHLADDARALAVLLVGGHVLFTHRVEDAALHGLEAVADVGERSRRDDRHRVGEIRIPHFVFDVYLSRTIFIQYRCLRAGEAARSDEMRGYGG